MNDSNLTTPAAPLFPQPAVPTVRIVSDETAQGFVIINEAEFDAKKHKKYVEKAEK